VVLIFRIITTGIMMSAIMAIFSEAFSIKNADAPPTQMIRIMEYTFVFLGMLFDASHCRIKGPKVLFDNNHVWSFSEDLAKQARARRSKGVVGRTGRKIPSTASPTQTSPIIVSTGLCIT
jgi:hypothetical protein